VSCCSTRPPLRSPPIQSTSPQSSFHQYLFEHNHGNCLSLTWFIESHSVSHLIGIGLRASVTQRALQRIAQHLRLQTKCLCFCHRECGAATRAMNSNLVSGGALHLLTNRRTIMLEFLKVSWPSIYGCMSFQFPTVTILQSSGTVRIRTLINHV
jgi:hypothetical protein